MQLSVQFQLRSNQSSIALAVRLRYVTTCASYVTVTSREVGGGTKPINSTFQYVHRTMLPNPRANQKHEGVQVILSTIFYILSSKA